MSLTPDPVGTLPRQEPSPAPSGPGANWFPPVVIVALLLLMGGLIFVGHEVSVTRTALQLQIADLKEKQDVLRHRQEASDERHSNLRDEVAATRQRLGLTEREVTQTRKTAKELETEQRQAAAQLGSQISTLREESTSKIGAVAGEVSGVRTDLSSTRKDLEATQMQLKSAIGDLGVQSGLIARNHDELQELKRRGERNYFEFDLPKEKAPRRIANISILLKRADPGKGKYTLEVVADDKKVEKKDKTLNEPVQFYVARARIPYEIVVNEVRKDRVVGYLATPK